METIRRRREDAHKDRILSSNDHVRNWYFRWKNMKESILLDNSEELLEKDKKRRRFIKEIENLQPKSEKEKKSATQSKPSRKDLIYLDLKPFKANKTLWDQKGIKNARKDAKNSKKKESAPSLDQHDQSFVGRTLPCLNSTWEHTNYSVVPTFNLNRLKKQKEKKKSDRVGESTKTQTEVGDEKNISFPLNENKNNKNVEVLYRQLNDFMSDHSKLTTDSGGEAVVIYQRQNRSNYFHPSPGDGYQFEQISFSGSCEETIDFVQSKRSLSEPLQKEVYVARRRTRFFLDPQKRIPTQSDFHSAIDFFQHGGSLEFNQFGSSVTKLIYKNPLAEEKGPFQEIQGLHQQIMVRRSKSNSQVGTGFRLRQTAEKKLDLHREMIRVEKMSKKKFWESIEKSLNYRCAVAQMFSSQSFLSSNDTSNIITGKEDSSRSTNIYLTKENHYVEKISSYQGFSTIITSTKADSNKKAKPGNIQQLSYSTIQQIKAVLDAILLKETEVEMFLKQNYETSSETTLGTDISPYDTADYILTEPSSKKLNEIESTLWSSNADSKIEFLMTKLSEEITKYSNFIKQFSNATEEKLLCYSSVKQSGSSLNGGESSSIFTDWTNSTKSVYPLFVYPTSHVSNDSQLKNTHKVNHHRFKFHRNKKKQKDGEKNVKIKERHSSHRHHTSRARSKEVLPPPVQRSPSPAPVRTTPPPPAPPVVPPSVPPPPVTPPPPPPTPCPNPSTCTTHNPNVQNNRSPSLCPLRSTDQSVKQPSKPFPCCDDCKLLKKRIVKLEEDLEKVQRIMPFCPKEHQDSIKNCLERLNVTSGTFLKKLKSYTRMRYAEDCPKRTGVCSKRSTSTPGPIVHNCQNRQLCLGAHSSECQMNVAMGITMENVDPVTGQKVGPDINWECQQEGNIQCALYKNDEEPVMVMDTDFSYNPKTGMLFSNKKSASISASTQENLNMKEIMKQASCLNHPECYTKPEEAYMCSIAPPQNEFKNAQKKSARDLTQPDTVPPVEKKEKSKPTKEDLLMELLKLKEKESEKAVERKDTCTQASIAKSRESMESFLNCSETGLELEESKKNSKFILGRTQIDKMDANCVSRIPIRRKATASSTNSKADSVSQKSSLTSFVINPVFSEAFPSTSEMSKKPPKLAKLFSFTWTFGFFLCKLVHYMQSVSAICSVLTLTAMSLERYYAIVHPMKAQYICTISQARRIITATWISAFLLAVPILFAQVHLRVGVKVEAYWCVRDWDNKTIWRAHELYMMLLILVVPTGVMAVAYTAICCEIWEVIQRRQDMTSGKGHGLCRKPRLGRNSSSNSFPSCGYGNNTVAYDNKRRGRGLLKRETADDGASVKQVIKMLVAVVVIYVLCWGPMLIDNVLQAYGILSHIRIGWLKYMGTTFHLMAYFNSCINPIIYGFMSKNFRESFRKTLCCVGKKPKTAYRSFSLSQTRNTSIRYAESSFGRTISIALPV